MQHDEPIIVPKKNRGDPRVGSDSLMILLPSELRHLAQVTKARRVALNDAAVSRIYLVDGEGSRTLTLCGPFLGAPQAVMAMEKLIALGIKRIWMLGWCGSLKTTVKVGDLVLPTFAFSDEGTSRHYPIGSDRPSTDKELLHTIAHVLEKRGETAETGPVWTTDAPYRESKEKVKGFQRLGAVAVEMELSALATVAIYRAIQFAALLVVSDELFEYVWRPGFNEPRLKKQTRLAADVLLEAASSFSAD
ncbi:MAG: phosphorylase [Deltaproteobacteria bacterium]|nr:MAG: phosphorylase [Deltaproteobacteria bacterium]